MNITEKFAQWPERASIPVRLHLYSPDNRERCYLPKLNQVFLMARTYGVQQKMETNTNRYNAVYVYLDNYVLCRRHSKYATSNNWGDHWGFLLELAWTFPKRVFVDPPEGTPDYDKGLRFVIDSYGQIIEEIETDDGMC
jgi:hypothetical protein